MAISLADLGLTEAEKRVLLGSDMPAPKRRKYNNTPTEVNGIRFDSAAEARRYRVLKAAQAAGEITDLQHQVKFVLQEKFRAVIDGKRRTVREIAYIADFTYYEQGRLIVEDVKGGKATRTAVFSIKERLFRKRYPAHELRIVEG